MNSDPVEKPECPISVILTADEYRRAVARSRELADAAENTAQHLERLALLTAIAHWEQQEKNRNPAQLD